MPRYGQITSTFHHHLHVIPTTAAVEANELDTVALVKCQIGYWALASHQVEEVVDGHNETVFDDEWRRSLRRSGRILRF